MHEAMLRDIEKGYKVKLPDRVALSFYDSFAHTQFQQMFMTSPQVNRTLIMRETTQ